MQITTPAPEGSNSVSPDSPSPFDDAACIGVWRAVGAPPPEKPAVCSLDLSQWDSLKPPAPDASDFAGRLAEASDRLQQQSFVMAVAGHDLRQPLQVILMVLDKLAPKLAPVDRAFAEIALSEIGHLGRGLDDLALASQLAPAAQMSPTLAPLSTQTLLDEIAGSWRFHARMKGLRVAVRSNVPTVYSNRSLVCAALRNLVGNAIKYTDKGGVLVCCRERAGQIRLEVWDSGPGIDAPHLQAIMQPYYQADPMRGGLGLGLVIAQMAAARLGASIEVATRAGSGSRFALCLPVAERTV